LISPYGNTTTPYRRLVKRNYPQQRMRQGLDLQVRAGRITTTVTYEICILFRGRSRPKKQNGGVPSIWNAVVEKMQI
jgi:hypothetical protein